MKFPTLVHHVPLTSIVEEIYWLIPSNGPLTWNLMRKSPMVLMGITIVFRTGMCISSDPVMMKEIVRKIQLLSPRCFCVIGFVKQMSEQPGVRPFDSICLRPKAWQVICCQSMSTRLHLYGLAKTGMKGYLLSCFPHVVHCWLKH